MKKIKFILLIFLLAIGVNAHSKADESSQNGVSVKTEAIKKADIAKSIEVFGNIEAEPAINGKGTAYIKLRPKIDGIIDTINVWQGKSVKKGDILSKFVDSDINIEIQNCKKVFESEKNNYERAKSLRKIGSASDKQLEIAEKDYSKAKAALDQAKVRYSYLTILAPFDGTITKVNFSEGESVSKESVIIELLDTGRIVAKIHIPIEELPYVKINNIFESKDFSGKITYIDNVVEEATNTVFAIVELSKKCILPLGTFIAGKIETDKHKDALIVPIKALYTGNDNVSKISTVLGNRSKLHIVKVGYKNANFAEICSDEIREGDTVITDGSYSLDDNTLINVRK